MPHNEALCKIFTAGMTLEQDHAAYSRAAKLQKSALFKEFNVPNVHTDMRCIIGKVFVCSLWYSMMWCT